jgi:hypothetical protein
VHGAELLKRLTDLAKRLAKEKPGLVALADIIDYVTRSVREGGGESDPVEMSTWDGPAAESGYNVARAYVRELVDSRQPQEAAP